jgi:hypothetical protein
LKVLSRATTEENLWTALEDEIAIDSPELFAIKPEMKSQSHWTKVSINTLVRTGFYRSRTISRGLHSDGDQYLSTIDAARNPEDNCSAGAGREHIDFSHSAGAVPAASQI